MGLIRPPLLHPGIGKNALSPSLRVPFSPCILRLVLPPPPMPLPVFEQAPRSSPQSGTVALYSRCDWHCSRSLVFSGHVVLLAQSCFCPCSTPGREMLGYICCVVASAALWSSEERCVLMLRPTHSRVLQAAQWACCDALLYLLSLRILQRCALGQGGARLPFFALCIGFDTLF